MWLCFTSSITVGILFITATGYFIVSKPIDVHEDLSINLVIGNLNGPVTFNRPEGSRFFYFYIPSTYTPSNPLPLIIYFHGYRSSWTQGIEFDQTVDAELNSYIIAFGQGTPSAEAPHDLGWNGGTCCLFNTTIAVDDVLYAKQVVALTRERVNIATDRVYAMGWSNGAFMVERLGCEASDVFEGVASDEGAVVLDNGNENGLQRCDAAFQDGEIDYIHFHGTADPVVPWVGGKDTRTQLPSTLENLSRWVKRCGCDHVQMQTYNEMKNFSNILWPNCRGHTSVELMTVWNAGHAWWTRKNSHFSTADYIMKSFTRGFQNRQKVKLRLLYKWY